MYNYDNIYRGIIIQNNDPEQSGRVKVFVPEVNAALIKNWTATEKNEIIAHMGGNTGTTLTPQLQARLRTMLPWAEVSLPIFGMSSPAFYDAVNNVSFIGNDSGLVSQNGNKTANFFEQDKKDEASRKNKPIAPDPHAKSPRQTISNNFPRNNTSCFPYSCGSGNGNGGGSSFPSIWLSYRTDSCLYDKISQLPQSYNLCDPIFYDIQPAPITDFDTEDNTTIISAQLDIVNPIITVNDTPVDIKNTIFGTNCFAIPETEQLNYSPPILFQEIVGDPPTNYKEIPIKLSINGNDKISDIFFLQKLENDIYQYISGKTVVSVAASNIKKIELITNEKTTDVSKLSKLIPMIMSGLSFIKDLKDVVMPRGTGSGQQSSRGGCGGSMYNSVDSSLLPSKMRRNALIGGNNPVSRETSNHGRKSPTATPNQTGSNLQGAVDTDGPYRPSNQGNNFKGMISIPAPGAHVYVRFEGGNPNRPIIMSTFAGQADYQSVAGVQPK
jgi:hypothetical protein